MEEICRLVETIGEMVLLIGVGIIMAYVGVLIWAIREYKRVDLRKKEEKKGRKLDGNNIYQ